MPDLLQRVQARFLRELFRAAKGGFVLKGGMAVSTLYAHSRLTRDVDLDFPAARLRTAESLHNQIRGALQQALRGSGIVDVQISAPGKAEVSPKWKVRGLGPSGEPFSMKVEVSRRPPPPGRVRQAAVTGVAAFGLGTFYVDLYDESTLAAMKLAALLERTAVRDVYDLDLLLPAHPPGPSLIEWALEHAGLAQPDALRRVQHQLTSMDWNLFRSQMLIDPAVLDRFEETTWEDMKGRVQRALTSLLDAHSLHPAKPA
ncbi:MAG TPA: nucleotidyl transferase AbiEii/AbiGii toxin family protein [Steroidobacteraceae bacterium]|nr:nucleotidyl transferase AbiEii/AbiGii toxin family protein [Steroidobacteraceae bacterium]